MNMRFSTKALPLAALLAFGAAACDDGQRTADSTGTAQTPRAENQSAETPADTATRTAQDTTNSLTDTSSTSDSAANSGEQSTGVGGATQTTGSAGAGGIGAMGAAGVDFVGRWAPSEDACDDEAVELTRTSLTRNGQTCAITGQQPIANGVELSLNCGDSASTSTTTGAGRSGASSAPAGQTAGGAGAATSSAPSGTATTAAAETLRLTRTAMSGSSPSPAGDDATTGASTGGDERVMASGAGFTTDQQLVRCPS